MIGLMIESKKFRLKYGIIVYLLIAILYSLMEVLIDSALPTSISVIPLIIVLLVSNSHMFRASLSVKDYSYFASAICFTAVITNVLYNISLGNLEQIGWLHYTTIPIIAISAILSFLLSDLLIERVNILADKPIVRNSKFIICKLFACLILMGGIALSVYAFYLNHIDN